MIRLKCCIYTLVFAYYVVIPVVYFTRLYLANSNMTAKGTILVTGGAGFVGSHTVIELLNNNYSVIAVDNLVNCYAESQNDVPESLKRVQEITGKTIIFYNVDIGNRDALTKIFKTHKVDCVIHFAALKAVGESVSIPLTYYQNNIAGSSTLFQVMQDNGVKKIVFSSSCTVYGKPQFLPITEEHPTGQGCTNPYGKSKYFVEEILKDVCISDKVMYRNVNEDDFNNYEWFNSQRRLRKIQNKPQQTYREWSIQK